MAPSRKDETLTKDRSNVILEKSIGTFNRSRIATRIFTQPMGPDQTFARENNNA